jgi:predicted transcriptional regulator
VKLKDVIEIVEGTVLTKQVDPEMEIKYCGAMDLMSDALAYMPPGSMLLTGLKNIQAIRTAEMADVTAILFVRGKVPETEAIKLAEELSIPLLMTNFGMFESCGRLYKMGMSPVPLTRRLNR